MIFILKIVCTVLAKLVTLHRRYKTSASLLLAEIDKVLAHLRDACRRHTRELHGTLADIGAIPNKRKRCRKNDTNKDKNRVKTDQGVDK